MYYTSSSITCCFVIIMFKLLYDYYYHSCCYRSFSSYYLLLLFSIHINICMVCFTERRLGILLLVQRQASKISSQVLNKHQLLQGSILPCQLTITNTQGCGLHVTSLLLMLQRWVTVSICWGVFASCGSNMPFTFTKNILLLILLQLRVFPPIWNFHWKKKPFTCSNFRPCKGSDCCWVRHHEHLWKAERAICPWVCLGRIQRRAWSGKSWLECQWEPLPGDFLQALWVSPCVIRTLLYIKAILYFTYTIPTLQIVSRGTNV